MRWLEGLPPQTRLGPNPSLFLDPFARYLRAVTGECLVVLPDTIALWDGTAGFAPLATTPYWVRVVLWALDTWEGDYSAQDMLTILRSLPDYVTAYGVFPPLGPNPRPLQEENDDD